MLDKSVSYTVIPEKFGICKNIVVDIKKNREKVLKFRSEMIDMKMTRSAKGMKLSDDNKPDQAVYLWFKQKRMEYVPVSGPAVAL